MKISRLYGLKYPNPKSGESMVLWYLRKFGIQRRDRAEHIRRVTKEMADKWVHRYESGESLKRIAGGRFSPVTVLLHLRKRSVQLRDKVEAQIKAVAKHQKQPFSGELHEKAYLLGLAAGDLYVTWHGRLVRVKTASTHPAMEELFKSCFARYGPVYLIPKEAPFTGYEWTFTADLDPSFAFLISPKGSIPRWILLDSKLSIEYVAGIFDAEGSVTMNSSGWFELVITNSNIELLKAIERILARLHVSSRITAGKPSPLGSHNLVWQLRVWRREDVRDLASAMRAHHPEKKSKLELVSQIYQKTSEREQDRVRQKWVDGLDLIEADRKRYIAAARDAYLRKRQLQPHGA